MKPTIVLSHFELIPAGDADLDPVCDLLRHPGVRRFLCDDDALPRDVIRGMLARSADLDVYSLGLWSVESRDGEFLGICGLQPVSDAVALAPTMAGGIEPVIALHPRVWGGGIATIAVTGLEDHARDNCGLARLVAAVDEPNRRSHRLMLRCGFCEIGRGSGPKHPLVLYERPLRAQA